MQGLFLEFCGGILRGIWEFQSFKIPLDAGNSRWEFSSRSGKSLEFFPGASRGRDSSLEPKLEFPAPKKPREFSSLDSLGSFFRREFHGEIPILAFSGIWAFPNPLDLGDKSLPDFPG